MSGSYTGNYNSTQTATNASATFGPSSVVAVAGSPGVVSSITGVSISALGQIAASGAGGIGMQLSSGGTVVVGELSGSAGVDTNAAIIGYVTGVGISGAPGEIENFGTIAVTGGPTGSGVAVSLGAGGTVKNAGAISNAGGTAVYLGGNGEQNVLALYAGSTLDGVASGGAGSSNTLKLAPQFGYPVVNQVGTVANLGTSFTGFGLVDVSGGAQWVLNGQNQVTAGTTLAVEGTLSLAANAAMNNAGTVITNGVLIDSGYLVNLATATITGLSSVKLAASGTLNNAGNIIATGQAVYSAGGSVTLNNSGTIIAGGGAGAVELMAASVSNSGTIDGAGGIGVSLHSYTSTLRNSGMITGVQAGVSAAGVIINGPNGASGALISSTFDGVIATGTLRNFAKIQGGSTGVSLASGATLVNGATNVLTASIISTGGDAIDSLGTVQNYAVINGGAKAGVGVSLFNAGLVVNGSSTSTKASITGYQAGISVKNTADGTVRNYGVISAAAGAATDAGVYLGHGGKVSNFGNGNISGFLGVWASGAYAKVVNLGNVASTGKAAIKGVEPVGVRLDLGGAVQNGSSAFSKASMTGYYAGAFGFFDPITVTNDGVMSSTAVAGRNAGVVLLSGGTVVNGASIGINAVISGSYGLFARGGNLSVQNLGIISGTKLDGMNIYQAGLVVNGSAGATNAQIKGARHGLVEAALAGNVTLNNYAKVIGVADGVLLTGPAIAFISNGSTAETVANISGGIDGVNAQGAAKNVTVQNNGGILGQAAYGVELVLGGTLVNGSTNNTAAYVTGYKYGFQALAGSGAVFNYGAITGVKNDGVELFYKAGFSGTVLNGSVDDTTAIISGARRGVFAKGGDDTVTNYGVIVGKQFGGVIIYGGTITNAGTITGGGGNAVALYGGGVQNLLRVMPGAVFNGKAMAAAGATNTLELTTGSGVGTVSDIGVQYVNFQTVLVDQNASWDLAGDNANAAGTVLRDSGALTLISGATLNNDNQISLTSGGSLFDVGGGKLVNTGTIAVLAGGLLQLAFNASFANAGLIGSNGALVVGAGAVLDNGGIINSSPLSGSALELVTTGILINDAGATVIAQDVAVYGHGGYGTVLNYGSIQATSTNAPPHYVAVDLASGGHVFNNTAASIIGGNYGVVVNGGAASTVTNLGTINAKLVGVNAAGLIENGSTANTIASISAGNIGVVSRGTLHNFGTISDASTIGIGVSLASKGLVVNGSSADTKATISGLNAGISTDTSAGGVGVVQNHGLIIATSGTGVELNQGGTVLNDGTISGADGTAVALAGTGVSNVLQVTPRAMFDGVVAGAVAASNTLELLSAAGTGTLANLGSMFTNFGSIEFDAGAQWNIGGDTAGLSGVISGFAFGDVIDVTGLKETVKDYSGGTLTLTGDATVELTLPGSFTAASFQTAPDGGTGTNVFLACFAAGTHIATPHGGVAVETLRENDRVSVVLGQPMARVIWIGHRHVDCAHHVSPMAVWPVRIRAGAFGQGRPHRDLWLSPDHAVFVDGVLIPVKYLINQTTIARVRVASIRYFHIELAHHNVLLAEGLPVESYLDIGDRANFATAEGATRLFPDFAARTWEAFGCAPLVASGARLASIRARLDAIAAHGAVAA